VEYQEKFHLIYIINSNLWQVLDIEFYNVKALYRRAQAYMETADFFSAELDIKKALETDPQYR
jgi:FK506-binding protein 4/5